jgi:hypothetical protein
MAQLMLLGLFLGKRLEVISDGARGIGDGVGGVKGTLYAAEQKRKAKQPITQNHPIGRKLQHEPVNRGKNF